MKNEVKEIVNVDYNERKIKMTKAKVKKVDDTIFYIETYDSGWHEDEDRYDSDLLDTHYFKGKEAFDLACGYMENCCEYLDIVSSGRVHPKDVTKSILRKADSYKSVEKTIKENLEDFYESNEERADDLFGRMLTDKSLVKYCKYIPTQWLEEQEV